MNGSTSTPDSLIFARLPLLALMVVFAGCSCRPSSPVQNPKQHQRSEDKRTESANAETVSKSQINQTSQSTTSTGGSTKEKSRNTSSAVAASNAPIAVTQQGEIEKAKSLAAKGNYTGAYAQLETTWTALKASGASKQDLDALMTMMETYGEKIPQGTTDGFEPYLVK